MRGDQPRERRQRSTTFDQHHVDFLLIDMAEEFVTESAHTPPFTSVAGISLDEQIDITSTQVIIRSAPEQAHDGRVTKRHARGRFDRINVPLLQPHAVTLAIAALLIIHARITAIMSPPNSGVS